MVLRIIVADDQASVREGLAIMLDLLPDITVVAQAANGREALDMVEEHAPDAILLDLHMPVLDGTETTRRLIREHPEVAVVILTTYADDTNVLETLKAGARAYITKDTDRADIAKTLHAAAAGLSVLGPQVQAALVNATGNKPDGLTAREAEILTLIARGLNNTEIAQSLFLSNNTVKTHINHIFAKIGARDRVAATKYAHRHNLV
ncbi:response regulator transcription factor [Kibdelosporangium lantanae]